VLILLSAWCIFCYGFEFGIAVCRDKKKTIAEYSLRNIHSPIAISTHRLPKQLQDDLPSVEQLETEINTVISELIINDKDKTED
jgi:hypothetical protein